MRTEERIEAARTAAISAFADGEISTKEISYVLAAFAPELFTDPPTMWLAPMEPTEAMTDAFEQEDADAFWEACFANRRKARRIRREGNLTPNEERDNVLAAAFAQTFPAAYSAMRDAYLQQESGE